MSTLTVLRPDGWAPPAATAFVAARRRPLAGMRLTVIDNGKPRARELLTAIAAQLVETYGLQSYDVVTKPGASQSITEAQGRELAAAADVFLTGLGDCAGCSACSLLDALILERSGRPATVVVSEPFAGRIASYSRRLGAPGYPVVVVPHPVASRSSEELLAVAQRSADAVAQRLGEAP
jgi:hypothetical protein